MIENSPAPEHNDELRRRAEERLKEREEKNPQVSYSEQEMYSLIHELSVHQIELEMQNDELVASTEALFQSNVELQQSLERYADLYDRAPVGYLTLSRSGKIIDANLTAVNLLGVDRPLLKGDRFARFVAPEDRSGFNSMMRSVCESSAGGDCQVKLMNVEASFDQSKYGAGSVTRKTLRIDAVGSPDGTECRITLSDISRQKEVEQENATLQESLAQAQKMDSIGRLAGGIAHDFNNMLTAILTSAELALRKADLDASLREDLTIIFQAASHSAELTRQLLAFARKQRVSPRILDLNSTIESVLAMLRRMIGAHIVLDWRPSPVPVQVRMDSAQIDQIVTNLCVNARDAIKENGVITLSTGLVHVSRPDCARGHACQVPGDYVKITVSDNGEGIDKKNLPHIFEPFFTTKEHGKGTGLGLAMVYGIVKQNHGGIECQSVLGKGTAFTIYLPRFHDVDDDPVAGAVKPEEHREKRKETILIVDDEPNVLNVCKFAMENEGYEVLAASSPLEAISIASEYPGQIHLLLTDVVMPDMNGADLANKLESMVPGLKTIFMSGYTTDIVTRRGVVDEGVNFVQKPFTMADLARIVREMLKRRLPLP